MTVLNLIPVAPSYLSFTLGPHRGPPRVYRNLAHCCVCGAGINKEVSFLPLCVNRK